MERVNEHTICVQLNHVRGHNTKKIFKRIGRALFLHGFEIPTLFPHAFSMKINAGI